VAYAYFRTFHRDVEDTIRNRGTPLAMPVQAVGGTGALGQAIPDQARLYAGDVTGAVVPCGHWVAEESLELLLEQLLPFLGQPNEHDTLRSDQAVTNRSRQDGNSQEFR
jgi:hypothetical protein